MLWNRPARRRLDGPAADAAADTDDLRDAYERGRRDERAGRKRHPVLMTLTILAAVAGGAVLVVAAAQGSFARGGQVVDNNLAVAADRAEPAARAAAAETGAAIKDAGRSLKEKAAATDAAG